MAYEVIDNVLPNELFESIQQIILSPEFTWNYQSAVTAGTQKALDPFYFASHLYINNSPVNQFYELALPILQILQPRAIIRIKANMYPNIGRYVENEPHYDYEFAHNAAVFYINSNDGYTILEDGTKIESVANRLLKFDGSKMHQSTHCTDQKVRVNINFNYF